MYSLTYDEVGKSTTGGEEQYMEKEKKKSLKELPGVKLKGLYVTQCIGTVYLRKQHHLIQ